MALSSAPFRDRIRALSDADTHRLLAAGIALAAGLAVLYLAHDLFPYHSSNHDEGVYLQQAAMLLEGRLFLTPGSDVLREAFHPWFFVESPRGFYSKYAPVPAAVFAVGKLFGGYRLALGAVAAINVGLGYALVAAAFDRRTGLVAAAILAAAPLFLLTSSVFLPYAPTTALNLLFALAYVRSVRRGSWRYAGLAGAAIGLAFFARPFTAVLFAAPFVIHAGWQAIRALPNDSAVLRRIGVTGLVGLGFVAVTLGYNAVVTGSAFLFPYQAFAPLDGLGFGRRAILGYDRLYTPELALRANAIVLWTLATDWFTAGPLGTLGAIGGAAVVGATLKREGVGSPSELPARQLQLVLLGVIVSVALGNILFWGNLNILADLETAGDGLISLFGPFYHFDLLLPMAALAAHSVITTADAIRPRLATAAKPAQVIAILLLLLAVPAVGAAEAEALGPPVERNAAYTEKFDRAYAPFESTRMTNALVFLPPAYGEWRNHPFQWLRNDPGFDGPAVYTITRTPAADFEVVDAYPDRTYYRYRYQGEWTPDASRHVFPVLEQLRLVTGPEVRARTAVTIPDRIVAVSVAVSTDHAIRRFDYRGELPAELVVEWTASGQGLTVEHPDLRPADEDSEPLPIEEPSELVLTITITEPSGATLTYREAVLVRPTDAGVEVLWPPASSVCTLVTDCGLEGTYLPDRPATRPAGIDMNTTLVEGGA